MQVQLLTPVGLIFEGECQEVLLPTSAGVLGIRTGHTELITSVVAGELHVKKLDGMHHFRVSAGSAEVTPKKLTILVTSASSIS